MIRVCIVCEGQTEANFVLRCLALHLYAHGVNAYPSVLQAPSGKHKGGRVTVERLVKHISHEYHSCDRITTLVDFYGFQDRNGRSRSEIETTILSEVQKCTTNFEKRFVLPYVQRHEFEGLLFTDIEKFQEVIIDGWSNEVRTKLKTISDTYENPEEINDSPDTAPSKRIQAIFPKGAYSKFEHGPLIAQEIGISNIRQRCHAFAEWVGKLEAWGK